MTKSDFLENKINDLITGKATYALPTPGAVWVALFTTAPNFETGAGGTEATGGSYARKQTAAGDWNASASGSISNLNAITFVTASASWGTVTSFGVYDASAAGNLLWGANLTLSKTIGSGDTGSFAAGALVHTED
jgi:hypothetical protein